MHNAPMGGRRSSPPNNNMKIKTLKTFKTLFWIASACTIAYALLLVGLLPGPILSFEMNLNLHTKNKKKGDRGRHGNSLGFAQTHEEIISSTFYTFATCGRSPK